MTRRNPIRRRTATAIVGLAGVMGAIAAGANLSRLPGAPGDNAMTTALPVAFYQTRSLEDVAAIAAGGGGYLITVEHTRELAASALDVPSEKTVWRFWKPNGEGAGFREASHGSVILPVSLAVVMTLGNRRLTAAALGNRPVPGYLLSWNAKDADPPQLEETIASHAVLALDPGEAAKVHLRPRDDWSTLALPASEWLFHPSLASLPGGAGVAFAADTADGRAVVWISEGTGAPRMVASVPAALNPVVARVAGKRCLLYRRMPADWSVYRHDPRHSGSFGPIALPLAMTDLEPGAGAHPIDLSKDHGLGGVFDFAAAGDGDRLVLAAIGGTEAAPVLRVSVGSIAAGAPVLKYSAALHGVPERVTLAVTDAGALIGLAYKNERGFDLEGAVVPLR